MKPFLTVLFLALAVVATLIEARPSRERSGSGERFGKGKKCQATTPCDLNGETLNDCKGGTTCASDPVTLTFAGQHYSVKVCVAEGETTNNISKALMKKSCQATDSTGLQVKSKTCFRGDNCTGGPISFSLDDNTITATFCQDIDEAFDFKDFLEDLKEHGKRSSRSARDKESSESQEESSESQKESSEKSQEKSSEKSQEKSSESHKESSESQEESSESQEDATTATESSESQEDVTTTTASLGKMGGFSL